MKSRWRKMLFANFVAWPVLCPHCGSRNIGRHPTIIAGCFNPGDYGVLCGDCGWEGTRLGLRWTWLQRVVRWINHVLRLDRIPPLRSFAFPGVRNAATFIPMDEIVAAKSMKEDEAARELFEYEYGEVEGP